MVESIKINYRGWQIHSYPHVHFPPYLDYNATASRTIGKRVFMFNVEGNTITQALNKAKERIDYKDYCVVWDNNIKLEECKFYEH
jgi:hypothetical protein